MQFARDHPAVTVVGVGAGTASNGDSVDTARSFVSRHGADTANMTMFYDASFRSWRSFGVFSQPWVVLFDANGQVIYNAPGRVDLDSAAIALGV